MPLYVGFVNYYTKQTIIFLEKLKRKIIFDFFNNSFQNFKLIWSFIFRNAWI